MERKGELAVKLRFHERSHRINMFFDIVELLVVRLTVLTLLALGAYTLIQGHL
jgi:hypothetical protein